MLKLKSRFARLAGAGLLALTACASAPAETMEAHPAMWKVADEDTTIYLFGTIHLLPPGTQWRSATFDKAANSADTLVVEVNVDTKDPMAAAMLMLKLGTSPGLPPLGERVSPDKKEALADTIAKSGFPPAALDRLETWAASLMLLGVQFRELGLDPQSGVEETLKSQFAEKGKSIGELETAEFQLGIFDKLPEMAQRKLLETVIESPDQAKSEFGKMLAAWSEGDTSAIAKSFNEEMADAPDLRAALLTNRNANWTKWIEKRLDQPGTVLVAVGAGHLAGDESVVRMLQHDGVKVTRVQ